MATNGRGKAGGRRAKAGTKRDKVSGLASLTRRLARVVAARELERKRHARQVAALRRARDRQIASLVQEIATLRHHEARVTALTRLVAERDATLAERAEIIARLETLLRTPST